VVIETRRIIDRSAKTFPFTCKKHIVLALTRQQLAELVNQANFESSLLWCGPPPGIPPSASSGGDPAAFVSEMEVTLAARQVILSIVHGKARL